LYIPSGVVPVFASNYSLDRNFSAWTAINPLLDFTKINGFQMNIDNPINNPGPVPPRTYFYNMDTAVDYIQAINTVPEPSTFILLGAGLIGAVVVRRRAKK
jgi:hypothetical protein